MDFLENCSSQELRNMKNMISSYRKLKENVGRQSRQTSHTPSALLRYKTRGLSGESGKSDCDSSLRNNELRRSRSLINLSDKFSFTSSNANHVSPSFNAAEKSISIESSSDDNESGEDVLKVSSVASLPSKSKRGVSNWAKAKSSKDISASISKSYIQLAYAAQILNSTLVEVQTSIASSSSSIRKSSHKTKSRISVPKLEEKDCLAKLANIIGSLSEQLEKEIDTYTTSSANRLEDVQNDNAILKQRLSNALNVQRNIEGELKELTRENKLLQEENKNLAMKIVPFIPDKSEQFLRRDRNDQLDRIESPRRKRRHEAEIFYKQERETSSSNNIDNASSFCDDDDDFASSHSLSREYCPRKSSTGFETGYNPSHHDDSKQSVLDASEEEHEISKSESMEMITRVDELDNIKLYVKSKNMDVAGLHGRLKLEEFEKLEQTVHFISQEKEELLLDLENVAESYREMELERDNYASILKMILREKNSSESNLFELLDGLLVHLNNSMVSADNGDNAAGRHHGAGGYFIESALHVIQGQNISLREEMARMRDSLQKTTGQNNLLQSNNDELTSKVQNMEKLMESAQLEMEQKRMEAKEKYESLEKLYNTDDLDKCLQGKEKEIQRLKDLVEATEKATSSQAKKIMELQKGNAKLGKEVDELKQNKDNQDHLITQLKSNMRDKKGKWVDRVRSASAELQQSKDHCKWLQTQIDSLNSQLIDAHERIKAHEKDKAALALRVLSADEERKILDRKILEIKSVMEGDAVLRTALAERNEVLQSEINRLRREKILNDSVSFDQQPMKCFKNIGDGGESVFVDHQPNTLDDLSSIASVPLDNSHSPVRHNRDVTPLSRKNRQAKPPRKQFNDIPRAAVKLIQIYEMFYKIQANLD
ncbi:Desmoplakin [Orchesella cincta]|uniref:Desmoplakin n=1 Tax=Orchesella cincta TaxID=48709 RepID=A0A1D2NGS7_ORCCI|nr:Desmoplakin [Orchesella cincta]